MGSKRSRIVPFTREWTPPPHNGLYILCWDVLYGVIVAVIVYIYSMDFRIALPLGILTSVCTFNLPEVSYRKLIESERILLSSVECGVQNHWSMFSSSRVSEWIIHSLAITVPEKQSTRPVVVLIHGHSAGSAHWESILDSVHDLADIFVIDMPGWGRSPAPKELMKANKIDVIDLNVEMLFGWLEHNNLLSRKIILMGHSYGGFLAIHFASKYQSYITRLILVSPAGLFPIMPEGSLTWGVYFKFFPLQRAARLVGRFGLFLARLLFGVFFRGEDPRFPEYYIQLAAATQWTGKGDRNAAHFLNYSLKTFNLWWSAPCASLLMALSLPVDLIWGQNDNLLPPVLGPLIHRIRPETDLYIVSKSLHNPAHNNLVSFCSALRGCLLKVSKSSVTGSTSNVSNSRRNLPLLIPNKFVEKNGNADILLGSALPPCSISVDGLQDQEVSPTSREDSKREKQIEDNLVPKMQSVGYILSQSNDFAEVEDSLPSPVSPKYQGAGIGYCNSCHVKVELHKSYFRCACAAWSFNAHVSNAKTRKHFRALIQFLDELYVYGTFDASSSQTIVMYINARTPFPERRNKNRSDDTSPSKTKNSSSKIFNSPGDSSSVLLPPSTAPFQRGKVFLV
jgi:pimeloyl-ACP methyl ester carboxylesterase